MVVSLAGLSTYPDYKDALLLAELFADSHWPDDFSTNLSEHPAESALASPAEVQLIPSVFDSY